MWTFIPAACSHYKQAQLRDSSSLLLHALDVVLHHLINSEFELFAVCNRMILGRD